MSEVKLPDTENNHTSQREAQSNINLGETQSNFIMNKIQYQVLAQLLPQRYSLQVENRAIKRAPKNRKKGAKIAYDISEDQILEVNSSSFSKQKRRE